MNDRRTLKIGAVSPRIRLCDVAYNVEVCIEEAKRAAEMGVRLLAFPRLTLTGATCGDLFAHSILAERAERGLADFIKGTAELDMVSVISLPDENNGEYQAVVYMGQLIGITSSSLYPAYLLLRFNDDNNTVLADNDTKLITDGIFALPFAEDITVGIDYNPYEVTPNISISAEASETVIGTRKKDLEDLRYYSTCEDNVYVLVNAGIGESTTDAVYSAHNVIAQSGEILAEAMPFAPDNLVTAEVTIKESAPAKICKTPGETKTSATPSNVFCSCLPYPSSTKTIPSPPTKSR